MADNQETPDRTDKAKESQQDVKKRLLKSLDSLDFEQLGSLKARSRGGSSIIIWSLTIWSR